MADVASLLAIVAACITAFVMVVAPLTASLETRSAAAGALSFMAAAIVGAFMTHQGSSTPLVLWAAALASTCWAIVETDRRLYLIPDALVLFLVALAALSPFEHDGVARALSAIALAALTFFVRAAFSRLRGYEGLGWGDVKLSAAAGALLGIEHGLAVLAISSLAATFWITSRSKAADTSHVIALPSSHAVAPLGVPMAASILMIALAQTFGVAL